MKEPIKNFHVLGVKFQGYKIPYPISQITLSKPHIDTYQRYGPEANIVLVKNIIRAIFLCMHVILSGSELGKTDQ